jgi:hypothetical protein
MYLIGTGSAPVGASAPASGLFDMAGVAVNVIAIVIALASLSVALSTKRDAQEGRRQQLSWLNESRGALDSVVTKLQTLDASKDVLNAVLVTAQEQQKLLDANLKANKEQLATNLQQWNEEQERLARRGKIRLSVGDTIVPDTPQNLPFGIRLDNPERTKIDFTLRNVGTAIGRKVVFWAIVSPVTVKIQRRGQPLDENRPFCLQENLELDLIPSADGGIDYSVNAELLGQVSGAFEIAVHVSGEGLETFDRTVRFQIVP